MHFYILYFERSLIINYSLYLFVSVLIAFEEVQYIIHEYGEWECQVQNRSSECNDNQYKTDGVIICYTDLIIKAKLRVMYYSDALLYPSFI
jgi:hypothetical protein